MKKWFGYVFIVFCTTIFLTACKSQSIKEQIDSLEILDTFPNLIETVITTENINKENEVQIDEKSSDFELFSPGFELDESDVCNETIEKIEDTNQKQDLSSETRIENKEIDLEENESVGAIKENCQESDMLLPPPVNSSGDL